MNYNKNFKSSVYWNNRYLKNGNSGPGSYNHLATFKADIINAFVKDNNIQNVIEFGCGDGNQTSLSYYNNYIGFDVSEKAILICNERFCHDKSKSFFMLDQYKNQKADITLSLDVIYHLVEDEIYKNHIDLLFQSSNKFVCIYSSNCHDIYTVSHVRHRKFLDDVPANFKLIRTLENIYPYDLERPKDTTFSDFYFFQKV